jgi:hypothetical protein
MTSLAEVERRLQLPPPSVVYCGTVHTGSGTFVGTGANGGNLGRSTPEAATLQTLQMSVRARSDNGLASRFEPPADHKEAAAPPREMAHR